MQFALCYLVLPLAQLAHNPVNDWWSSLPSWVPGGQLTLEEQLDVFDSDASPEEKREIIRDIYRSSNRTERLVVLFSEWGRRTEEFDRVVHWVWLDLLDNTYHIYYGDEAITNAVASRLREEPGLIRQFFWIDAWLAQGSWDGTRQNQRDSSWPELPNVVHNVFRPGRLGHPAPHGWRRWIWLLRMASMLDRPELAMECTTLEAVDHAWEALEAELREDAPYYYFDADRHCFVLDQNAKSMGSPVIPPDAPYPRLETRLPPRENMYQ